MQNYHRKCGIPLRRDNSKIKIIKDIEIIDQLRKDQLFVVHENEKKTFVIFLCDGKDGEGEVKINIRGKNADVQILGIIIGFGKQKINLYTYQGHEREGCKSDLLIKSVLFDEAKFRYKGLIRIEKDAQKSNAYQKNQNLLMTKNTWADSQPVLEILANEVRCTHGATVGKINPEELYYLMTRGVNEKTATNLIVTGFLQEVIDRIGDNEIKKNIQKAVKDRLAQLLIV